MKFKAPHKDAMGLDVWYENPYLVSRFREDHKNAVPQTHAEARISLLYSLWAHRNTMPWQWDFEHYPEGKDDEMYGIFYPEDFEACLQISGLEAEKKQ